jgi:hypothetical protein
VAKSLRANPFSIIVIINFLVVIGVLSWRLEEAEAKPDVSTLVRPDRPSTEF